METIGVLIPFQRGNIFKVPSSRTLWVRDVLIPFQRGNIFKIHALAKAKELLGLNPLSAGQYFQGPYRVIVQYQSKS